MTPFEIGIIFGAMAGWAGFFYLIKFPNNTQINTNLQFVSNVI